MASIDFKGKRKRKIIIWGLGEECGKLLDYLKSDKTYVAQVQFGYVTSTFDSEAEPEFVKSPNFSRD